MHQTLRLVAKDFDLFAATITREEGKPATLRIPMLPAGKFEHPFYGSLNWTGERFDRMISNFNAGVTGYRPMVNIDHASHNPYAVEAPAYAWITALEKDAAGLWAQVELTDLGVQAIEGRRYRYISAEVANEYANSTGATYEDVILGAAFTNTPFHDQMPGLFTKGNAMISLPTVESLTTELQRFSLDGEPSFEDIRRAIGDTLRAETKDQSRYCYVLEVFPSFVIYEEYDYTSSPSTEKFYKRAYAYGDGTVTLGVEKVEVEQVWAVKAQQAFRQALNATLLSRKGETPANAGTSAGATLASQRKRSNMLLEFARKLFGMPDNASEADVAARLATAGNAVPAGKVEVLEAVQGEPLKPQEFKAPAGQVLLAQERYDALTAAETELATVRQNYAAVVQTNARNEAAALVEQFAGQGKITPAMRQHGEGEEDPMVAFAMRDPEMFKRIYSAAPAVVDLSKRGGLQPQGGHGEGAGAETFEGAVRARQQADSCDYGTALSAVAKEKPELYRAYLERSRGGRDA